MDDDLKNMDDMDDLEAQLSALGMFENDSDDASDADPFAGLGLDDDDDPFASLGGAPEPATKPATSGGGEMDLDKQLEMLLMADEVAEDSFEAMDISSSLPTQTVYDPEVDGMGSVQYVKGSFVKEEERKAKMFSDISGGKMLATAVIGVLLIIAGAVTAIFAHSMVQGQQAYIADVSHFTPIAVPVGVSNSANFIHVNERAYVGEIPFSLMRISAAYSGTFFYFEESFNPDDFYILLYNQARNLYARTSFDITAAPEGGTILKFAPLSRNALFVTLHIQCRNSNEYARFNYRFTAPPIHDVPVFINRPVVVLGGDETEGLVVRHAVFDSGSSKIHFSYAPNLQTHGLRLNPRTDDTPGISLRDMFSVMHPMTNEDAVVYFDEFGITIGAATFGPIFSLESNVEITFHDLTYFYPNPVVEVTPEELFGNNQWFPLPVEAGTFTINLEGMAQQGSNVVLTLHGLDENNRRVATDMDITLRVTLDDGGIIDMPGDVRVSAPDTRRIGTDVIFSLRSHTAALRDVHVSQYELVIDWVAFDVPAVTATIRVSPFYNMQSMRRYSAELAVREAFVGLLSHKAGEISADGIIGLSPEMHRSDALFEIFAPTEFEGRAMYGATVSAGDMVSNYDYIAVVEVSWAAGEGADLMYFRETFKVTARSENAIWKIVDIVIL